VDRVTNPLSCYAHRLIVLISIPICSYVSLCGTASYGCIEIDSNPECPLIAKLFLCRDQGALEGRQVEVKSVDNSKLERPAVFDVRPLIRPITGLCVSRWTGDEC
jgi:hypothetical protein